MNTQIAPYHRTKAPKFTTTAVYSVDPVTRERTLNCTIESLVEHPLFLASDVTYYHNKGFTMGDIKRVWDWEWFHMFA